MEFSDIEIIIFPIVIFTNKCRTRDVAIGIALLVSQRPLVCLNIEVLVSQL